MLKWGFKHQISGLESGFRHDIEFCETMAYTSPQSWGCSSPALLDWIAA